MIAATDVDNPRPGAAPARSRAAEGLLGARRRVPGGGPPRWADVTERTFGFAKPDEPGAGAAGGLGFAVLGFLGATLRPGIELMLNLVAFFVR